jgi:multiple sugar transport system substrate-binding protein
MKLIGPLRLGNDEGGWNPRGGQMRSSSRKRVVGALLLVVVLALAAFTAAGSGAGTGNAALSGTVTVWDFQYASPEWGKALKMLDKQFMKKNPGVTIKHVGQPFDNYNQVLQTAFASRSGPDVVMLLPAGEGVLFFKKALERLDARITPTMKRHLIGWASVSEGFDPRKGIYAVPTGVQANVFYYNKNHYKKAGLDPNKSPKTYSELVAHLKALKAAGIPGLGDGNKEGYMHEWMFTALWGGLATAAEAKALASGKMKFTHPKVQRVVNLHLDLFKQGLTREDYQSTPMWPNAENDFAAGKSGVVKGLASAAMSWVQFNKKLGERNVGVFQALGVDSSKPSFLPADAQVGWSITKYSKNKDAAFAYIQFLTGTVGATTQLAVGGVLSNNQSVKAPANVPVQVKQMLAAFKSNPTAFPPHGLWPAPALAAYDAELQLVFAGKQTVLEALEKVEAKAQQARRG